VNGYPYKVWIAGALDDPEAFAGKYETAAEAGAAAAAELRASPVWLDFAMAVMDVSGSLRRLSDAEQREVDLAMRGHGVFRQRLA
jgi:hypothetical protein